MSSVTAAWQRIEAWLEAHHPKLGANLNPPASDERIADARARLEALGSEWPEELGELYRLHDGQPYPYAGCAFISLLWLPLEELVLNQTTWRDLLSFNEEDARPFHAVPEGAVKSQYVNRGWVPFAHDGGGNHLGVDLDPGPTGTRGQIINFGRDQTTKYVFAPSLAHFLDWMLARLESDRVRVVEDESRSTSGGKNFEITDLKPERWMMALLSLLP